MWKTRNDFNDDQNSNVTLMTQCNGQNTQNMISNTPGGGMGVALCTKSVLGALVEGLNPFSSRSDFPEKQTHSKLIDHATFHGETQFFRALP